MDWSAVKKLAELGVQFRSFALDNFSGCKCCSSFRKYLVDGGIIGRTILWQFYSGFRADDSENLAENSNAKIEPQ